MFVWVSHVHAPGNPGKGVSQLGPKGTKKAAAIDGKSGLTGTQELARFVHPRLKAKAMRVSSSSTARAGQSGEMLAAHTTFGLGGPCDEWAEAASAQEVGDVLRDWCARKLPWHVLGGGSNVLAPDEGVRGGVLHLLPGRDLGVEGNGTLVCSAGESLDRLVQQALEEGRGGSSWAELSGIPGTVGGAICGNAGAFGVQLGDFVERVEVVFPDGHAEVWPVSKLSYGYRSSALQRGGMVVTRAWLRGTGRCDRPAAWARRAEILALRQQKHPALGPGRPGTAGSFFKNLPPETPGGRRRSAGALLEAVGAKSQRVGGAYVFERHANILMAGPGTTAADVRALAARLQALVRDRFPVELTPEVRFWP